LAVAFGTQVVIWVAVGGRGTLLGPFIAAILLGQVQNYADRVTQDWQLFVGILLLVVVLFLPDGLMGLVPKKFRVSDTTRLLNIVGSNSPAGFVQARLFDWYTPLKSVGVAWVGVVNSGLRSLRRKA
jgi:urea transport system permease protein